MQIATEQDIHACFRLILGREMHDEERDGHFGLVGMPLGPVVSTYLQSLEFRLRGLLQNDGTEKIVLQNYSIYVASDDTLIAPGIRTNAYEPEVTKAFTHELTRKAGAAIDIGANCGWYSMLAASHGREVYAFEPLQRNLRLLHASRAANGFRRLHIFGAAASDSPGTLVIGASFTNGIVGELRESEPATALLTDYVASVCVDVCVPRHIPVAVIKIDVEGHEYRAITGASKLIQTWRPAIISEFFPRALDANSGHSAGDYLDLLESFGYALSVIGDDAVCDKKTIFEKVQHRDHIDILARPKGDV